MAGRGSALTAWLPFGAWVIVIIGLSSVPDLSPPDVGLPLPDKLAHLGEYGVLGALFGRARGGEHAARRAAIAGAVLGLGFGTLDEIYQRGTPGRESSVLDVLADCLGATLGCVLQGRLAAFWKRRTTQRDR